MGMLLGEGGTVLTLSSRAEHSSEKTKPSSPKM